jgi:hypothetical protein
MNGSGPDFKMNTFIGPHRTVVFVDVLEKNMHRRQSALIEGN